MKHQEARRAEVLAILRSHGALEQYTLLQGELNRLEAETEALRQRFLTAEKLESGKTELDIERAQLLTRLRQDYHEQDAALRAAILTFEEISNALSEKPGSRTISPESNGPRFAVNIHTAKSKGVSNCRSSASISCWPACVAPGGSGRTSSSTIATYSTVSMNGKLPRHSKLATIGLGR
jgi:uncharacterized protein YydD (DUF2326 family)